MGHDMPTQGLPLRRQQMQEIEWDSFSIEGIGDVLKGYPFRGVIPDHLIKAKGFVGGRDRINGPKVKDEPIIKSNTRTQKALRMQESRKRIDIVRNTTFSTTIGTSDKKKFFQFSLLRPLSELLLMQAGTTNAL
jgi:hypothetical protein